MKTMNRLNRVLFLGAGVLLAVAVIEKLANGAGYTLMSVAYTPGRLLEFSGILMLFVIALLLREIRDQGNPRA